MIKEESTLLAIIVSLSIYLSNFSYFIFSIAYGQLGIGQKLDSNYPLMIKSIGDIALKIAAGNTHSLIVTKTGSILAAGDNSDGQLGINSTTPSLLFTLLKDMQHIKVMAVSAGNTHSACISTHGELYIWGSGCFGQFLIPHLVKNIKEKVTKVSLGCDFGVVVTATGQLYVWGNPSSGKLGIGDNKIKATP